MLEGTHGKWWLEMNLSGHKKILTSMHHFFHNMHLPQTFWWLCSFNKLYWLHRSSHKDCGWAWEQPEVSTTNRGKQKDKQEQYNGQKVLSITENCFLFFTGTRGGKVGEIMKVLRMQVAWNQIRRILQISEASTFAKWRGKLKRI